MELVLFTVAVLVVLCIGAGAESLVRVTVLTRAERTAMAVLLGCFAVAALSFSSRLLPDARVATQALMGAVTLSALYRLHVRGVSAGGVLSFLLQPACLTCLALLAPLLWLMAVRPLGWDAMFVWALKSRAITASGGHIPLWYFADVTRGWSHPDYPLQLPLLQAWVYECLGREHQVYGKLIGGLYLAAAVPLLFGATARLTRSRLYGVLVVAVALTTPQVLLVEGGALSGYVDFPLAIVYCAAAVALLAYVEGGEPSAARLTSALVCSLATLKTEGVVLGAAIVVIAVAHALWQDRVAAAVVLAAPFVLTVAGWRWFLIWAHAAPSQDFIARSLGDILLQHRWPLIGHELLAELTRLANWSLVWPVALVGLAVGIVRPTTRRPILLVVVLSAGPVLLFQAAYLFSAWDPVQAHIQTSLPRLLLQVAPLALVGAAYGIGARATVDRGHG